MPRYILSCGFLNVSVLFNLGADMMPCFFSLRDDNDSTSGPGQCGFFLIEYFVTVTVRFFPTQHGLTYWTRASEVPKSQGFLVVVDGPLRQPFSDYMMDTEVWVVLSERLAVKDLKNYRY